MATATETLTPPPPAEAEEGPWRPSAAGWAVRLGLLAGLLILLIWTVATVSPVWADRIALAAIYAIIGLSLNIVMGYVGQVSLGHHAFVGLAAFASAFMVTNKGQSFPMGLLVACLFGGFTAGLLGLVALRIKGLYLALITLTYGFVAVNSFFEIPALTGGGQGLEAPRPNIIVDFRSDAAYAYLCLAFLGLVLFVDWRLLSSKVGRGILAVKESEAVASSYAINVTQYKVIAFVLSGVFAGLAGSLFAHKNTTVVAADFNFATSLLWVLMVVVGGLGNRVGVVLASAFFALFTFLIELIGPLEHFLTDTFKRAPQEFEGLIGALLALLTIILHPGGVSDQVAPIVRWFGGKKFTFHPEDHGAAEKKPKKLTAALGLGSESTTTKTEEPAGDAAAVADDKGSPSEDLTGISAALRHASGSDASPTGSTTEGIASDGRSHASTEETTQIPVASTADTSGTPEVEATSGRKKTSRRRKGKSEETSGGES